ncbi:UNVERIFIED_ORG: hypothetical protein JN05_05269 [Zoogloea ramigera]
MDRAPAAPASNPLSGKISAMLDKAENFIALRQFDKAIATAEAALDLDPASGAAKATLAKAKTKQSEALKSGSSIE